MGTSNSAAKPDTACALGTWHCRLLSEGGPSAEPDALSGQRQAGSRGGTRHPRRRGRPLRFTKRPTLVPAFTNQQNPKRIFTFPEKKATTRRVSAFALQPVVTEAAAPGSRGAHGAPAAGTTLSLPAQLPGPRAVSGNIWAFSPLTLCTASQMCPSGTRSRRELIRGYPEHKTVPH